VASELSPIASLISSNEGEYPFSETKRDRKS
jgi:hypothetical protein